MAQSNLKPSQIFHIYQDRCPDEGRLDQRDPACPACQLLLNYERLTAGLSELEKRLRAESESHYCQEYNRELGKGFRACADELAALLRGNDDAT